MTGWRCCRRGATALLVASTATAAALAAAITAREGQLEGLREPQASPVAPPRRRTAGIRRDQRARNLESGDSVALSTSVLTIGVTSQHDDEQHPSEHETERTGWAGGGREHPVEEPPSIAHILGTNIDRCSRWDMTEIAKNSGTNCGPPLSKPCFDRSRCQAEGGPKIYVFDQECSLGDSKHLANRSHKFDDEQRQSSYWREAVWRAGLLAETYEEACLFVHVNTHNHEEPCATRTPLWNGGVNHVLMEFTPWWIHMQHRPRISSSYAMDWAFDHQTCFYRSGYDLSVPLKPKVLFPQFASVPATKRTFFLTFKGALYLEGFGVEERAAVSRLHDEPNGIVSLVRCFEGHGEHLKPENIDYCAWARHRYQAYDYEDLMDTTFALVPAGRSPGTFRLGEVMSAGAIPVFVVRDWVRPYEEKIDWSSFSFVFAPDDVGAAMVDVLRAVEPEQLLEMQRKSLEAYWELFGGATNYSVIAETTVEELVSRFTFH